MNTGGELVAVADFEGGLGELTALQDTLIDLQTRVEDLTVARTTALDRLAVSEEDNLTLGDRVRCLEDDKQVSDFCIWFCLLHMRESSHNLFIFYFKFLFL
eukprot:TRINITY_DN2766_c0_g3_i1.p1 TRINITY_DN2766_c0_g3~~TRINITY_DN2766_c0_g3_i1.p1  ORF type:complete len:101 (-),score=31.18 TRINITY_DN2766_c0_g3_i1:56-358(-)